MNLQSYHRIKSLLKSDNATKEQHRAFALKNNITDLPRLKQLFIWVQNSSDTQTPSFSYTKGIQTILLFLAFVFGFFAAVTLLHYSGDKPVNVIYFFTLAVIIPLLSMFLSLFALFFPKLFTPLFLTSWIERLLVAFSSRTKQLLDIQSDIQASFSLFLIQLSSLLFSLGLLLGFLLTILTQDIAFGWSTTLQISAASFYEFLHSLSFIFANFCPQSLISMELIEKSHYFRLGQEISQEMQTNAALFGEWWKFLACSTLFYAVLLRLLFLFASYIKLQKSFQHTLLALPEAQKLLEDMNEPIITTNAQNRETAQEQTTKSLSHATQKEQNYYAILGWTFSDDELLVIIDALQLQAKRNFTLGGTKSLQEDNAIIEELQDGVLLLVKAWEIPTMEFIDILQAITNKTKSVTIYPLGYAKNTYLPSHKDRNVWETKIAQQNFKNVSIKI